MLRQGSFAEPSLSRWSPSHEGPDASFLDALDEVAPAPHEEGAWETTRCQLSCPPKRGEKQIHEQCHTRTGLLLHTLVQPGEPTEGADPCVDRVICSPGVT